MISELTLGPPQSAGPLTIFPVLAPDGELEYLSFAEAATRGFVVKELQRPDVNALQAHNPLDVGVLLFEGEEVVGAQQDRVFDQTILVGAGQSVRVPVSCVEHGRWDGARHGEAFGASPRAAFPELRSAKNRVLRASLAAGAPARTDQSAVWNAVAAKRERMGARSATGAMGDIYSDRASSLDALEAEFTRLDGQVGTLACLAGKPVVLDVVSRAEVFAGLFRPLVRGYCLDALERETLDSAEPAAGEAFLTAVGSAKVVRSPVVGVGETIALTGEKVGGTGLAVGDECVALTVFAEDGDDNRGRILRPSRRQRA